MAKESKQVTPNEARELVDRLSTLIREHGKLQAEVIELRESLELLHDLRELLDTAPGIPHAMHNGHTPHRSMTVPAGDRPGVESPALDDVSSDDADDGPVVDALDDDPAASHRDDSQQDAGDRAGVETIGPGDDPAEDAGDVSTSEPIEPDATEPPSGKSETGGPAPSPTPAPGATASASGGSDPGENTLSPTLPPSEPDADVSPSGERPAPGTLMAKIYDLIEASARPKRPWQVEKELGLTRQPTAELSRLVAQGHLRRVREGIYGIVGRDYGAVSLTEGLNS